MVSIIDKEIEKIIEVAKSKEIDFSKEEAFNFLICSIYCYKSLEYDKVWYDIVNLNITDGSNDGGIDFVYYDDSDFLWRVRKHHKKLIYVPTSTLYHKVSVSTGGSESPFSIKYSNRNQIFFIKKNFGRFHKWVSLIYVYLRFYLKQRSINSVDKNKLILDSFHEGGRLYKQKRSNAE